MKGLHHTVMETLNREELYSEIWEQPMLKVAPKYGISGVMLGKVCRKLQIPVPGRGYWARKESGKPIIRFSRIPVTTFLVISLMTVSLLDDAVLRLKHGAGGRN